MKKDLEQYMYQLRIEAEVNVIEMVCIYNISMIFSSEFYLQEDQEISAYAYERTLKLAERVKLLKDLKLPDKELQLQVSISLNQHLTNNQLQAKGFERRASKVMMIIIFCL